MGEYAPPFERLDEQWELTEEQEQHRRGLEADIVERWPNLTFAVQAQWKYLKRGKPYIPAEDEYLHVGYLNGPRLMDMRSLIAGRARHCGRSATAGAVLWVDAQSQWRDLLRNTGRYAIQPFDLTPRPIAEQIDAIDQWADSVGLTGNPSQAEGWELVFAANEFARRSGTTWPTATDAHIPQWKWDIPANT